MIALFFPVKPSFPAVRARGLLLLGFLGFVLRALPAGALPEPPCDPSWLLPEGRLGGLELAARKPVLRWDGKTLQGWSGSARPLSNSGTSNRGVFLLTPPSGEPRILRVSAEVPKEGAPERFLRQLEGMRLQETLGGPKLFEIGTFYDPAGVARFFVEMECLFCGQDTATLKDAVYGEPNTISRLEAAGTDVLGAVGDRLAAVLEARVLPVDPDLIVGESGGVRWLDGERWQSVDRLSSRSYEFAEVFWTMFEYSRRALSASPDLWGPGAERFLLAFFKRLQKTPKLTPAEKQALYTEMFRGRAAQDYRTFDWGKTIPFPEVEPLYQMAWTFYKDVARMLPSR